MSDLVIPGSVSTKGPAPERPTRESLVHQRSLRERFLADPEHTDLSGVRDVIARSWRRSSACRVDPDFVRTDSRESKLDAPFLQIAEPILQRLDDLASDTGSCLFLSDSSGTHAIRLGDSASLRWADSRAAVVGGYVAEELTGTNSDGTALEEGTSVQVWGPEHYAEGLQETFCTSAPIMDALRSRIVAVLTLMAPETIALNTAPGALALPVEWAASEISRQVAERLTYREQAVLRAYMRETRLRGAEAVLAVDDRTTIASNSVKEMLTTSDYAVLSAYAREARSLNGVSEQVVSLSDGRLVSATVRPVTVDDRTVGAVLRLKAITEPSSPSARSARPQPTGDRLFSHILGSSPAVTRLRTQAVTAVGHPGTVCITGERGTGRALLAAAMAAVSSDQTCTIDCSSGQLSDPAQLAQCLESAAAGQIPVVAVHFDQITSVGPSTENLLRAAARAGRLYLTGYQVTEQMIATLGGTAPLELRMPPLRSRRDDIPILVEHFLRSTGPTAPVASGKLLHALAQAEWPGNVAELREVVLAAGRRQDTGTVCVSDLTEHHQQALARGRLTRLESAELEQIRHAMMESNGNRARAADLLEIGRSTLYRKIELYTRRGYDLGR